MEERKHREPAVVAAVAEVERRADRAPPVVAVGQQHPFDRPVVPDV